MLYINNSCEEHVEDYMKENGISNEIPSLEAIKDVFSQMVSEAEIPLYFVLEDDKVLNINVDDMSMCTLSIGMKVAVMNLDGEFLGEQNTCENDVVYISNIFDNIKVMKTMKEVLITLLTDLTLETQSMVIKKF